MYFLIPDIQGFKKYALKKFSPRFFSCDVMASSAAWASPISGPRWNFENSLGYFSQNISKMCHEKFQGPMTFLLSCRGGPKIVESLCSIKGWTVERKYG
jgi:hypothetical protein